MNRFDYYLLDWVNVNASNYRSAILPRDASQQISSDILTKKKDEPNIGDIIYFKNGNKINHVGLYIDKRDFIHSSGFVKVNSIDKKSKYYSDKLKMNFHGIYRIKL